MVVSKTAAYWVVASLVVLSVLPDTAKADHPLSDARLWGVHPPCYNGTMEIGEMAAKCRPMHMTTQEKDRSQYSFLGSGQWHHYHFAINDFKFINREFGSKVHFQLEPCRGSIFLYVKPAMLYEGKPMMQMFETDPYSNPPGQKSKFWPFPDENTATNPQGPDSWLVDPGQEYPGPVFKVYPWGFKSENEGVMNGVSTKLVHGAYFISIWAQEDTDYRFSVYTTDNDADPDPNLSEAELKELEDAEKKVLEDRRKSTKQESVLPSYGRYSKITWETPLKNLKFQGRDESRMWDLSQFDDYQLWYAMDSRTHYHPIQPRQVIPPAPLDVAIDNDEVDAVQGYCSFNSSGNASSNHCIMETECGIRLNGLPYTEKLNKDWDEKDYVLKKEICVTTATGPACTPHKIKVDKNGVGTFGKEKTYMGKNEWVRYEMRRNPYSPGGDLGAPCGWPYYAPDGFDHPNYMAGDDYRCKQGLRCDASPTDGRLVCQKAYLEFKTMTDAEVKSFQAYLVTHVPHHCWETGEQFCMKGSKRFDAPRIPVRRKLTIRTRNLATGDLLFDIEGIPKPVRTLEDAMDAAWKEDGLYGNEIAEVFPADVPKMRKVSDITIVTRINGFRGNTTAEAALEMPCAQPWPCSMFTFRSRTLAINVERYKCLEVHTVAGIPKCKEFHIVPEVYVAAIGNTSFDKETEPGGADEQMSIIAIALCAFFGTLIAAICFMRARTAIRLHLAYKHAAENLDGMPDGINPEKEKAKAKRDKEAAALAKKEEKLWEKQKKDRAKEKKRKAKEMEKRLKNLEKERMKKFDEEQKALKKKKKENDAAIKKLGKASAKQPLLAPDAEQ